MGSDVSLADRAAPGTRIQPGTREQIGTLNFTLARLVGWAAGGGPPNLFTTLARHRGLFRPWLRFAGALMPGGRLPREDSELLILRVAHNCRCEYEWRHHERLGREAGLDAGQIERVRQGAQAPGWSDHQAVLIRAADELHAHRSISTQLWASLSRSLCHAQLIELCMLVGHYEMLAMTINSLAIEPDAPPVGPPPRAVRFLQARLATRRRRGDQRSS